MTYSEIKDKWFAGKEVLEENYLSHGMRINQHCYYKCPCGADDHCASRAIVDYTENQGSSLSCVLHCHITGRQWLIRPKDIVDIIRREEEAYIKLTEKAPAIVKKVITKRGWSYETRKFLFDTHGIDEELANECMDRFIEATVAEGGQPVSAGMLLRQ